MDTKPLTPLQAASLLGVSKSAIVKWFHEGKFLNAYKVGNAIRIPASDVEALKQRPKKAV